MFSFSVTKEEERSIAEHSERSAMPYQSCEDVQISEHARGGESRIAWSVRSAGSVTLCSSTGGLYVNHIEKQPERAPLVTHLATLNGYSDPGSLRA
jgi:hypothetical protein